MPDLGSHKVIQTRAGWCYRLASIRGIQVLTVCETHLAKPAAPYCPEGRKQQVSMQCQAAQDILPSPRGVGQLSA